MHVFWEFRPFCFPFRQTSAICIYPSKPPGTCMFFLVTAGVADAVLISLSSDNNAFLQRKSTASLALFLFRHTLAHVLIHQRKN